MRSHLVKGADRIELTIRSYTDRTGRTPKKESISADPSLHREG